METTNPSTGSGQVSNMPEADKQHQPKADTNKESTTTQEPKPPTLVGMVANVFHHLSLRETATFIAHKPLAGVAFILIFILVILSIAVSLRRKPQSYFIVASPTPTTVLATPQPILSAVGKTQEFQTLETNLSSILDTIKNVDLSESKLTTPLLETNITFEN